MVNILMYTWITLHIKLIQHCKSTVFQYKQIKYVEDMVAQEEIFHSLKKNKPGWGGLQLLVPWALS